MKRVRVILLLLLLVCGGWFLIGPAKVGANQFELPAARVTVKVLDENQQPITNANVWFSFKDRLTFKDLNIRGLTGANGLFTAEGGCDASGVGCEISKAGYYIGFPTIPKFHEQDEVLNRWKPWNKTYTVILRPISNSVDLYAKKVQTEVPVLGQPCGYDLETGDWVAPYGKGTTKDLIFNIQSKSVKDALNFSAEGELTFTQPLDGLQETSISNIGTNSIFKWERQAPENAYKPMFKLQNTLWGSLKQKPVRSFKFDSSREWEGYFFRVRSVVQDGKIISAHFGKIRGGIEIDPRDTQTCAIIFTYYYNPTPLDRNLEWNSKHNLFGRLSWEENPREP
jgi:hypothetical protein